VGRSFFASCFVSAKTPVQSHARKDLRCVTSLGFHTEREQKLLLCLRLGSPERENFLSFFVTDALAAYEARYTRPGTTLGTSEYIAA
jgi:hypothetical protein